MTKELILRLEEMINNSNIIEEKEKKIWIQLIPKLTDIECDELMSKLKKYEDFIIATEKKYKLKEEEVNKNYFNDLQEFKMKKIPKYIKRMEMQSIEHETEAQDHLLQKLKNI